MIKWIKQCNEFVFLRYNIVGECNRRGIKYSRQKSGPGNLNVPEINIHRGKDQSYSESKGAEGYQ